MQRALINVVPGGLVTCFSRLLFGRDPQHSRISGSDDNKLGDETAGQRNVCHVAVRFVFPLRVGVLGFDERKFYSSTGTERNNMTCQFVTFFF